MISDPKTTPHTAGRPRSLRGLVATVGVVLYQFVSTIDAGIILRLDPVRAARPRHRLHPFPRQALCGGPRFSPLNSAHQLKETLSPHALRSSALCRHPNGHRLQWPRAFCGFLRRQSGHGSVHQELQGRRMVRDGQPHRHYDG